jgi:hypothetical protein
MSDLRLPVGAFFLIVGAVLVAIPSRQAPLTSIQVNLYAGLAMLLFGGAMLWLALARK